MDIAEIHKAAREKLKGYCRVCGVCNGKACAGEVPGMGGSGTGTGFRANLDALAQWRLRLRTLHGVKEPALEMEMFGHTLSMPIMAAPITGMSYNCGGALTEEEFSTAWVKGAHQAGTLAMTGDGGDPAMYDSGIAALEAGRFPAVPVIKPRSQEEIVKRVKRAEENGAVAVGVDVDGAGLLVMSKMGQPVGPKSPEELAEIIGSTSLPFIIKGIMTSEEAEVAATAGAAAIVVSNHGGRVLDHTPGTAEVLPEISAAVRGRCRVLVDGGIRAGVDVLKMLALGAEAVLIGRPLMMGVFGNSADGLATVLESFRNQLLQAMLLTGVADVRSVSPGILQ
jgi:isopentenyl diphosphate isomerase/L-lactate dehydrogenase-like FMN-dependent dehydrogenase